MVDLIQTCLKSTAEEQAAVIKEARACRTSVVLVLCCIAVPLPYTAAFLKPCNTTVLLDVLKPRREKHAMQPCACIAGSG